MSALIAFEAAARHQSITRAASEIALTESAVSRQIAALEEQLGVRLFHRIRKRISLTPAGAVYGAQVGQLLERLERETQEVMAHEGEGGVLAIASLPTVGSAWLIPRLGDFQARHPEIVVHVSARSTRFLFPESALDGALFFGQPNWPGADADYLFGEELLPVGAPGLLEPGTALSAQTLAGCRLLHLMTRPNAWRDWCRAAGITEGNPARGARFETQAMLIGAACAGQGLALLPRFLIEDDLRGGRLRIAWATPLTTDGAYYFAYPHEKAASPPLLAFRGWLREQAASFGGSDARGGPARRHAASPARPVR